MERWGGGGTSATKGERKGENRGERKTRREGFISNGGRSKTVIIQIET